mmetsp:Transcript_47377/g.111528  ORF Transcript_47377/g.111528 Transcript_47377/m.111528 type:complete len:312 (-) Transcript_47377:47-982(-)
MSDDEAPAVVQDFDAWAEGHPEDAVAVAAIHALTNVLKKASASTVMELQVHIKSAAEQLLECKSKAYKAIQLQAACDLFVLHVTRNARDLSDLGSVKSVLIDRGERFAEQSQQCRLTISSLGSHFIHDEEVILTHGASNVVVSLLLHAARTGRRFRVLVTEAQPGSDGVLTARRLRQAGIPAEVIIDSAVGHVMERVDLVIVGAQGVVENGGIINKIGTNQMAIVAKANKKPFYVAAESYKFARFYPLNQSDLPEIEKYMYMEKPSAIDEDVMVREPILDYTPPLYITLLFTDLGVLTPAAVSDELIKLYY